MPVFKNCYEIEFKYLINTKMTIILSPKLKFSKIRFIQETTKERKTEF